MIYCTSALAASHGGNLKKHNSLPFSKQLATAMIGEAGLGDCLVVEERVPAGAHGVLDGPLQFG